MTEVLGPALRDLEAVISRFEGVHHAAEVGRLRDLYRERSRYRLDRPR